MLTFQTPIEQIPGIGPITLKKLKKLDIKTVNDFIFHFPSRYEDYSNILPIAKIKINEVCTISGKISDITSERSWKRQMFITRALITDKTGSISALWFNRPYLNKTLKNGDNVFLSGKISIGKKEVYFSNPSYEKLPEDETLIHTAGLVPVYPETEGLGSRWLRYLLKPILLELKDKIPETIPLKVIKENNLLNILLEYYNLILV